MALPLLVLDNRSGYYYYISHLMSCNFRIWNLFFLILFLFYFLWMIKVITGYLLAGSVIGPGGFNFVSEMVQVCFLLRSFNTVILIFLANYFLQFSLLRAIMSKVFFFFSLEEFIKNSVYQNLSIVWNSKGIFCT